MNNNHRENHYQKLLPKRKVQLLASRYTSYGPSFARPSGYVTDRYIMLYLKYGDI